MAAPGAAAWRVRGVTVRTVFAMPQVGQGPGTPARRRWYRLRQQAPETPLRTPKRVRRQESLTLGGRRPLPTLSLQVRLAPPSRSRATNISLRKVEPVLGS